MDVRSLRSDRALAQTRSLRSDRAEHVFGCCVTILFGILSDDSRFLRKAFCKDESISKKYLSKKVSTFFFFGDLDVNFVVIVFDPNSEWRSVQRKRTPNHVKDHLRTGIDRLAWSHSRSSKAVPVQKTGTSQDPRPPPRMDLASYQPMVSQMKKWGISNVRSSSEIIPDGSGAGGTLPTENKDT
ncbi:hypothetical protein F2Q68_00015598 [Brassica cretica]|uniref:Uncharacterized protein n=1 Tax=Brassica cretica TaxID=69181 RepID=A0A8S9HN98_BRACR|nr:hypothetical protein F2Q68_00015598 [Brassica cretica]